ncbi:MAG: hypothetical protein FJ303_06520 [Planctomycetes bacterium]|nr:hypothetical protein [Planctomycetota bacterium]
MSFQKIAIALLLGGCLVVAGVSAMDILNPGMAPEKGTFDKPHGKLGTAGKGPWSGTTIAAGVDGKPLPGKVVKIVGEIIDISCYTQLGKHGTKHRDCGQKCLRAGQPIGLLTKEGKVYLLMDEEHDPRRDGLTNFRQAAIEHMAYVMEVTGTLTEVPGANIQALYVRGYLKQ